MAKVKLNVTDGEVVKAPKKEKSVTVSASYRVVERDTGLVSVQTFTGKGSDIAEALEELNFPTTSQSLVTVKLETEAGTVEKSVAPHNARRMLGMKDVAVFTATFRGYV